MWKNSLESLSGYTNPFIGLSSGGCIPVFSDTLSTPVFSRKLLNRHRGHLYAFGPVCALRLSSSELTTWSIPFTQKFVLDQSLLRRDLLFLFNIFRASVAVEVRHDLPLVLTGNGATHASQANTHYIRPSE